MPILKLSLSLSLSLTLTLTLTLTLSLLLPPPPLCFFFSLRLSPSLAVTLELDGENCIKGSDDVYSCFCKFLSVTNGLVHLNPHCLTGWSRNSFKPVVCTRKTPRNPSDNVRPWSKKLTWKEWLSAPETSSLSSSNTMPARPCTKSELTRSAMPARLCTKSELSSWGEGVGICYIDVRAGLTINALPTP